MEYKLLNNFNITDKAKQRIDEIKEENKNIFIRIMITTGGCAGHQYHILMDDYIGETDYVLQLNDKNNEKLVYLVIDETSLEFVKDGTIDFEDNLEFSGFKIDNPNVKATCNCGNSFSCTGGFITKKDDCKN